MAFDGVVTRQVVKELNTCLIGGKINKVFMPNKNEILLGIYSNGKNYSLLINIDCSNCRMHLTTNKKPNPFNAPNFCMLLRKHLIGMKIKSIETYDLERIVTLVLEGYDELNDLTIKKLVIELMGKHSNVILLNQSSTIIDSMRHIDITSNATRDILPAHKYIFPSNEKISFLEIKSFEEFYESISPYIEKEPIDEILSSLFVGISKLLVNYVIQTNNIDTTKTSEEDYKKLYTSLNNILNSANLICVPFSNSKKVDYVITQSQDASSLPC